jgi:hypothetical protein
MEHHALKVTPILSGYRSVPDLENLKEKMKPKMGAPAWAYKNKGIK